MNFAVILAGGTGTRAGSEIPKQFVKANGKPIIGYCIDVIGSYDRTEEIVVICAENYRDIVKNCTASGRALIYADPGKTRQLSIVSALNCIRDKFDTTDSTVMIYDAARPYISHELLESMYKAIDGHDGVMPVLPMKDTVYECKNGKISGLLDRSSIFAGQAPELFVFDKYYEANAALLDNGIEKINGSSEPAIMGGMDIVTVPGDEKNIKITTSKDLEDFINAFNSFK